MGDDEKEKEKEGVSYIDKIKGSSYWNKVRSEDIVGKFFFDVREVQGFYFQSRKINDSNDIFTVELTIIFKSGNESTCELGRVDFDFDSENRFIIAMRRVMMADLKKTREYLEEILGKLS